MKANSAVYWTIFGLVMGFFLGGTYENIIPNVMELFHGEYGFDEYGIQSDQFRSDSKSEEYTFWLTLFTGVLAVATVGLGITTLGVYLIGKRQFVTAQQSSEAAKMLAKAAIGVELPIIQAVSVELLSSSNVDFPGGTQVDCIPPVGYLKLSRIRFVNHGRTQALSPIKIAVGHKCGPLGPEGPDYKFSKTLSLSAVIDSREEKSIDVFEYLFEFDTKERREIGKGNLEFWVYGALEYGDFLGGRHESRFCWRWSADQFGGETHWAFRLDPKSPEQYTSRNQI